MGFLIDITLNDLKISWLIIGLILIILAFSIYRRVRDRKLLRKVTSLNRGTKSERNLILGLLKRGTPPQTIFHDLCLEKSNGKFSQIDVVVVTTEGIIVFEVKDYSGWIFGNANHSHWTKVLAYGKKKYRFYNPIKQNQSHIKSLRMQSTQFNKIPFYSVVVFYGNCELKEINYVPNGTYLAKSNRIFDVLSDIRKSNIPAPYTDKREIIRVLEKAVLDGNNINKQKKHVENIKDMIGKDRIYN